MKKVKKVLTAEVRTCITGGNGAPSVHHVAVFPVGTRHLIPELAALLKPYTGFGGDGKIGVFIRHCAETRYLSQGKTVRWVFESSDTFLGFFSDKRKAVDFRKHYFKRF